jgi:hypothetical protein
MSDSPIPTDQDPPISPSADASANKSPYYGNFELKKPQPLMDSDLLIGSFSYDSSTIDKPSTEPRSRFRDAVQVYGTEVKAVDALRRQIGAMSAWMEKKQLSAALRSLKLLETGHRLREIEEDTFKVTGYSARVLAEELGRPCHGPGYWLHLTAAECADLIGKGFIIHLEILG